MPRQLTIHAINIKTPSTKFSNTVKYCANYCQLYYVNYCMMTVLDVADPGVVILEGIGCLNDF